MANKKNPYPPRKCPVCGKAFIPARKNIICCSVKCSKDHYAEKNKSRVKAMRKEAMEKNGNADVTGGDIRFCRVCGKEFVWNRGTSGCRCKECLNRNRQLQRRMRKEIADSIPKPTHLCADCHKVYTFDHRCPECLAKWRARHGVPQEADYMSQEVLYHANI